MKQIFYSCLIILFSNKLVFSSELCFIAKEKDRTLISEGNCTTPYSPKSIFKIALSLIGFDSNVLKNDSNPRWELPKGVNPYINTCKKTHDPKTWMRDSCLFKNFN